MDTNDLIKLAKAHNLLTDDDDVDKHAKVAILDLDDWVNFWREKTGIEDPTALFTDNKVGVKESELLDLGFKFIDHGTVYGFKKENGVDTLVFSVQFFPLERAEGSPNPLTPHDQDEIAHFSSWLYYLKHHANPVKTNAAHKHTGGIGIMYPQGWRAGSDLGFSMGLYAWARGKVVDWIAYKDRVKRIAEFYTNFFERLSANACEAAKRFIQEHALPTFGMTNLKDTAVSPGSSVFVSCKQFTNAVHRDRDCSPTAFGIWTTTRDSDQKVVSDAQEVEDHVEGGQFFLPDYAVALNFNHFGGIACVTWRAPTDRHGTSYTKVARGYERWGSSIQVTKTTLAANDRVRTQGKDVHDDEAYMAGRQGNNPRAKRTGKGSRSKGKGEGGESSHQSKQARRS
ncbi:hypothetical protein FRC07_011583 [Ceratobasidium sp. 392]|nr:hypothetical protein FRC07_011583 [Ceratobasidium sp. 392]